MASRLLKNAASVRFFRRSLCYYCHNVWSPSKDLSSSLRRCRALPGPSSPSLDIPLAPKNTSILPYRYLSSTPIDPEHSASKIPADVVSKEDASTKVPEDTTPEEDTTTKNSGNDGQENKEKAGDSHQSGSAGKPIRGGPVSWLSFILLMLTGAGLVYYYDKEKKQHIEELKTTSTQPKQGPSVGKAAIGGPFKLLNHHGKPVTEQDFLGKWTLIYFGFTHCPDICPDELQKLAAAVDKIKEKAGLEIVPVFISVDPERDTVEQVHEYVQEFHPSLVGLTGDSDSIRQAARAYRVYYMKTEEEGSDYLVDHSIVMYLMDPKMEFVKFFGKNYDVDALTEGIIKEIKECKS
ncbi:protein SCO1 homolog 1, mitochondrial [Aristolochia californica]|uniref:protein SCO1 homolog 1, mitochondrial n=1 Tax=Aristolochia californica TaxID=171875 RepID=UPI0035D96980